MSTLTGYLFGVATVIIIILILYLVARYSPFFKTSYYQPIFCNFPAEKSVSSGGSPNN